MREIFTDALLKVLDDFRVFPRMKVGQER